jgi:hypothetical protein
MLQVWLNCLATVGEGLVQKLEAVCGMYNSNVSH